MEKKIIYNGKEYTIQIQWGGSSYCLRVVDISGFHTIPSDWLNDIEKIKYLVVECIKNNHDLKAIELWDGVINNN